MKGSRALIMLLLSLVAGIAAMVLAARWLNEQSPAGAAAAGGVAAREIEPGQPRNASTVTLVPWPAGSVPEGSFPETDAVDGRVLRTQLLRGEPVLEAKLAPAGTKGGLSAVI